MSLKPWTTWVLAGTLSQAALAADLFQFQGKTYTDKSLDQGLQQALFEVEYESYNKIKELANRAAIDLYVQEEAKKQKKPTDEVRKTLFTSAPASDKEVSEWYEKNKARIPYPFDQIKEQVRQHLAQEKSAKVQLDLLEKWKKNGSFALRLPEPKAPTLKINTDPFPSKGPSGAKAHMVVFADYQCPHCKDAAVTIEGLIPEFKDKLRLSFIDFPLSGGGLSKTIAQGAFCALKQNKFWEFHFLAFKKQSELKPDSPAKLAEDLKLKATDFNTCLNSAEAVLHVDKGRIEGDLLGISGTPAIFINGKKYMGGHDAESIRKAIKAVL